MMTIRFHRMQCTLNRALTDRLCMTRTKFWCNVILPWVIKTFLFKKRAMIFTYFLWISSCGCWKVIGHTEKEMTMSHISYDIPHICPVVQCTWHLISQISLTLLKEFNKHFTKGHSLFGWVKDFSILPYK